MILKTTPRRLKWLVKQLVEGKGFNIEIKKHEVVRVGLRLLHEREQIRQIKLEEICNAFQKGINSGKGSEAEQLFDRLEAKYCQMSNKYHSGYGAHTA